MAAPIIPISILVIPVVPAEVSIAPVDLLVAPEVGAVYVISLTGVLDLVDYSSSSYSDPSEDSLPLAPELPLVSPFLCSDDLEADGESEPGFVDGQRFLFDPVRLFPLVDLTAPIPMGRVSYSSSDSPSNSLSDSSSVHSLGCDASGQSHLGPSTRVASPRLVYPSVRTPRCSEAFMRWRSASLFTLYKPTTSESSLDSSSERSLDSSSPSARPSRKRCRSLTTLFRDSYSSEASEDEHMEIGNVDVEAIADLGIGDGVGASAEDGIGMRVDVANSDIREDEEEFEAEASARGTMEIAVDPLVTGGISESTGRDIPDLEGTLYDIDHYMYEVPFDRITKLETTQR
ncbi:hypothetical protein Tco_0059199 [Tanacetum coccineum]